MLRSFWLGPALVLALSACLIQPTIAQTSPFKPTPEVRALLDQAQKARRSIQPIEEQRAVKSALDVAQKSGDVKGQIDALRFYGEISDRLGKREDACRFFQDSADIAGKAQDKSGQALALAGLGQIKLLQGQNDEAKRFIDRAAKLGKESRDPIAEGIALSRLANWHWFRINYAKTLALNREALRLFVLAGDRPNVAVHKMYIGMNLSAMGQGSKAIASLREALDEFIHLGDRAEAARCRTRLAPVYFISGDARRAVREEELALAAFVKTGDIYEEADAYLELGYFHEHLGDSMLARNCLSRAEEIARSKAYSRIEISALLEQAYLDEGQGSLGTALVRVQRALDMARRSGDRVQIARALVAGSYAQLCVGQYRRSIQMREEARKFYAGAGARVSAAWASFGLTMSYLELGDWPRALNSGREALSVFEATNNQFGSACSRRDIGRAYLETKQYGKSLRELRLGLAGARAINRPRLEADILNYFGRTYFAMGRRQDALRSYRGALTKYASLDIKDMVADTLTRIGVAEDQSNNPELAKRHFIKAVTLIEQVRSGLGGNAEAKSSTLTTSLYIYSNALDHLVRRKLYSEAFDLAQKTKARTLIDLLASGRVDLSSGLTADERNEDKALRNQADTLNAAMVKEGVENEIGAKRRYAALQAKIKETESKLQAFTETLYARHPELSRKRAASTSTIRDLGRFLPFDTALLDYVVVNDKRLIVFAITNNGNGMQVRARVLGIPYEELAKRTAAFRGACADPRKEYRTASRELYASLIALVQPFVKSAKRLLICPDGALWDVPFQALMSTGRNSEFLSSRYEVAYAYSATGAQAAFSLASRRRRSSNGGLLVCANPEYGSAARFGDLNEIPGQRPIDSASRPIEAASRPLDIASRALETVSGGSNGIDRGKAIRPLPGTQREADTLQKLFADARILTGVNAEESTVKEEAGKYRYLHFATHGFVNDGSPLLSSVVLANPSEGSKEDGFLTAREIYGMNLNAEMTVLSACNTARGETRTGEGVIGLTWALFVAGCPTQIVSQWAVDDASTAMLMGRFYENLKVRMMGKAGALKEAESWLRQQDPKYRHPYYWAPFVLNGAWK